MMRALVIVAHPDDETIWMGGMIIKNKSWNWTIASLCRRDDPDRAPKFRNVCASYGANPIISNLDDENLKPLKIPEVVSLITREVPNLEYDYIFTHGKNGEYGHLRHCEVHQAVKKMVNEGLLKCNKLLFFSYRPGEKEVPGIKELKVAVPYKNGGPNIILQDFELNKKLKMIQQIYGFNEESFETLCCNKEETFSSQ
jgi:LmbE family N-acetylglucosaminyl deacetylase